MNDFTTVRLRCPDCRGPGLLFDASRVRCQLCSAQFPMVDGKPVLIRHDNEVFPIRSYVERTAMAQPGRQALLAQLVPGPSVNLASAKILRRFASELAARSEARVLVVGGGKQRSFFDHLLGEYGYLRFWYCDVDAGAAVDLYCDAHELPFEERVFEGVITTAVLEHVMYPERAICEMHRVLVDGGLIYSELPFMQQVHEGAYDFTRYSLSGHRRLCNQFNELSSGVVAGPGTALVWAVEHFALCFVRGRWPRLLVKAVIRLALFWVKYFDYMFRNSPQATDGA
ncbi:MAG: class I SAM-dependent methyltransferase, partial [Acidobacteria bacterium]|nr:class I SAM-dependent methyltransferase [Acidobacteriota bacterium]